MTALRVGLIGVGIGDSLTPAMHLREARHLGLEYEYRLLEQTGEERAGELRDLIERLRDAGYAAVNVTHPFKQRMLDAIDDLTVEAREVDAVNLVHLAPKGFSGDNTDWSGFRWALDAGLSSPVADRVIQYGAGGAGGATAYALLRRGCSSLLISDTEPRRAERLAQRFGELFPDSVVATVSPAEAEATLGEVDGVVHATPIGMKSHPGVAVPVDAIAAGAWVAEVVYFPVRTELVALAQARGHRVLDGTWMAVGQAIDSLRLITGSEPDAGRVAAHMQELLEVAP